MFDTDKKLVASSKIGMEDVIKSAGKATEAKLGQDNRPTVWKIDIIDDISKNRTIYFDAQTGMAKRANCPNHPRYSGRSSADGALARATHFMPISALASTDDNLFEQVDIWPVSIGGRATYFEPKDASGK